MSLPLRIGFWTLFVALIPLGVPAAERLPNVVIFYADDLGWGELSCQGSKDIARGAKISRRRTSTRWRRTGSAARRGMSPRRIAVHRVPV